MIQFVGRDAYKQFWNFSKDEKENLATQLAIELPALRGKVGASQEEIASAVGISRQTYSAYENRTRPIPWSLYLALLFYFDYIPSTHYMMHMPPQKCSLTADDGASPPPEWCTASAEMVHGGR